MKNKVYITWEEVFERLDKRGYSLTHRIVYGVPKGGMILTGFFQLFYNSIDITHNPNLADFILDDIWDSGATEKYYRDKYPNARFITLFDKRKEYANDWLVFPWEAEHPAGEETIQQNLTRQLQYIGENPKRDGLLETPNRIVRSWDKIYEGYSKKPEDVLTVFSADGYDQIILLKDIEMFSMCEHHMLPFFGKAHIAYIPKDKIVGISKLARLVDIFARRLQIQERIGEQVTSSIMRLLDPLGAACIIEAQHMCMKMRGIEKQNSVMVTSSLKGVFLEDNNVKQEFLEMIK